MALSAQRNVWLLYVERKRAVHIFCTSAHPPPPHAQPNLLKAYLAGFENEHPLTHVTVHSYFVKSNAQVTLSVNHILTRDCLGAKLKRESGAATFVVLESPLEATDLIDTPYELAALEDLPVLKVGAGRRTTGGLEWERAGAGTLARRLVEVLDFELGERLGLARFAELPLCNVEGPLQVVDTLVSRILRDEKHLLWYSSAPFPDLGRELANFSDCGNGVSTNPLRL